MMSRGSSGASIVASDSVKGNGARTGCSKYLPDGDDMMIKDRLARHLTALIITKIIVLVAIWAAFFRAPPGSLSIDPATHVLPMTQITGHGDRP